VANYQARIGLEQEFFLVDETGELSHRADEFLDRCRQEAIARGQSPTYFVPEFVKSIVEINTPPAYSPNELARFYLQNLEIAIHAGRQLGLRLYPFSSYPLHIMPIMRDKPWYHLQVRTVGFDRILHAGKCTGTHLHLEARPGSIDSRVAVAYTTSREARQELLNLYNLATALDAAMIALSRACPFYEGEAIGLASHTIRYRGSDRYGWEGVYTQLPLAGGLRPYATTIEHLVELQFERHYAWLQAMERAGMERHQFQDAGGNLLESAWNPIRLNDIGTVEIRSIDSNYPEVVLAILTLVYNAAARLRHQQLTVQPIAGLRHFELEGDRLLVPDFDFLSGELLYHAATEGIKHSDVRTYVDSLLAFAVAETGEGSKYLAKLKAKLDGYQTIEEEILKAFVPATAELSIEAGLQLVRQCCDSLEQQIALLNTEHPLAELDARIGVLAKSLPSRDSRFPRSKVTNQGSQFSLNQHLTAIATSMFSSNTPKPIPKIC